MSASDTGQAVAARPFRAAAWMMGAVASFTSLALAARAVSIELDTVEIIAYRALIGAVIVIAYLTLSRRWHSINARRLDLHLARNVSQFTAQMLWFFAIISIPLAQVFALEFTAPLWVLALSPFLLGERLTRRRVLAGGIGFAGILLVAQPGMAPITPGLTAAAACAIGFALTHICTKHLTEQAPVVCLLWWMTVMQTILGVAVAGLDGDVAIPSAASMPALLLIGATGLSANLCVAQALKLAPATIAMPFDFLRLPLIAGIGMAFYNEPVGPVFTIGAALILYGNFLNLRGRRG